MTDGRELIPIDSFNLIQESVCRETPHRVAASFQTKSFAELPVTNECEQCFDERASIPRANQPAVLSVTYDLVYAVDGGGQNRSAGRHRFDDGQAKRLNARVDDQQIQRAHDGRNVFARSQKTNSIGDA